jgi:CheY-like chemotaxis protein
VSSIPGEGSIFSIDVPLSTSQTTADEKVAPNKDVFSSSSLKEMLTVLIVDDEPAIVDAMEEVLSIFDMNVVTAGHGAEALAHIQEGLEPDFVLTDYRMPEINGVDLVIKIRNALNKEIPVVIMTGDTSAEKIKQANLAHCTILHKPVDMDKLMPLIESFKSQ